MARERLDIRIPEDLGDELASLARKEKKNLSVLCRELIEESMNEDPGRLREQLVRSLAKTQALLLRAEDGEILDDVGELVEELDEIEEDLEHNPDGEEESDEDEDSEPQ